MINVVDAKLHEAIEVTCRDGEALEDSGEFRARQGLRLFKMQWLIEVWRYVGKRSSIK